MLYEVITLTSFRSYYFAAGDDDLPMWADILWNMAAQASQGAPKAGSQTQKADRAVTKRYLTDLQKKVGMQAQTRKDLTDMVDHYLVAKQPLVIAGETLLNAQQLV